MKDFLKSWAVNTLAVLVATQVVPGISYNRGDWLGLLLATLALGILNTFLKPILLLLSLPLVLFTLGLFTVVINALLLWFVGYMFKSFHVDTFGAAVLGAIVISIISFCLNALTGTGKTRIDIRRGRRRKSSHRGDNGPFIDV